MFIVVVFASGLMACSPGYRSTKGTVSEASNRPQYADPGFPAGYMSWDRFNLQTIIRADPQEARDLYYNALARGSTAGVFPPGTVLVKAHYTLIGGRKAALSKLSVMTKGSGAENGGWAYTSFDPKTGANTLDDSVACAICHSQSVDNDFVFSNRSGL